VRDNQVVVCNSEFTRAAVLQEYEVDPTPLVVYPPVNIGRLVSPVHKREAAIVSVGRFSANKRQFEQIQLAERLPAMPFHIFGFASQKDYYQLCHDYVQERRLGHVHLHPDAPYERMQVQLTTAKFFLHTIVKEPFGITTIQAIAAGCIPIVHDSGGSRETVPIPELRFQHLDQVPAIIAFVEGMDEAERLQLVGSLQDHVTSHFDASIFHRRMRDLLLPLLGISKN
jgi:glycosyltransferase involved in cell wall biosynthesis